MSRKNPPEKSIIKRSFLSDADSLTEGKTESYGPDWAVERAVWVHDAWSRSIGGKWPRHQSEYYAVLRRGFELYRDQGVVDEKTLEGSLLSLLRPGPVARFTASEMEQGLGKAVVRSLKSTENILFSDPFYKKVGSRLLVLIGDYIARDDAPRFHSHLGEEFVFILEGKVTLEWIVPSHDGKSFLKKRKILDHKRSFPHHRSAWFKSECPHRVFLEGNQAARLLFFYSDPRGGHAIIEQPIVDRWNREPNKILGTQFVDDDTAPERLWAIFSGIGARIERGRRARGWTIKELATLAGIESSHLNRIEDGKITPSIDTASKLAATLDVPLSEILPSDVLTYIEGCYLHHATPVWEILTGDSMPNAVRQELSAKRKANEEFERVQIPYIWRDYSDLLVLPAASPIAKSLLPLNLHVSRLGRDGDGSIEQCPANTYPRKVAMHNYQRLREHVKCNALWNHASKMIIFVRRGSILLKVCRFSDIQVFPFLELKNHHATDSSKERWFDTLRLREGDLIHLDCEHLHRFELDDDGKSDDYYCSLLCVIGRPCASDAIRFPDCGTLREVFPVRNDDLDFYQELQRHNAHRAVSHKPRET